LYAGRQGHAAAGEFGTSRRMPCPRFGLDESCERWHARSAAACAQNRLARIPPTLAARSPPRYPERNSERSAPARTVPAPDPV